MKNPRDEKKKNGEYGEKGKKKEKNTCGKYIVNILYYIILQSALLGEEIRLASDKITPGVTKTRKKG